MKRNMRKKQRRNGVKVERNALSTIEFKSAKADMGYKYEKSSES